MKAQEIIDDCEERSEWKLKAQYLFGEHYNKAKQILAFEEGIKAGKKEMVKRFEDWLEEQRR